MSRFFVQNEQIEEDQITIIGKDVNHIKNVLRKKVGDLLEIVSKEKNYKCIIDNIKNDSIKTKIIEEQEIEKNKIKITIFQGIPKFDKMELVIQKSVELGVYEIVPIEMERCVVKLKQEDRNKKIERWQKIAEVASKQCERNDIPKINSIMNIKEVCKIANKYDAFIIAYEKEKENKLKYEIEKIKSKNLENINIAILIGPEGGISNDEIENLKNTNAKIVTLGNRILRTETVALNVLSVLMYELET